MLSVRQIQGGGDLIRNAELGQSVTIFGAAFQALRQSTSPAARIGRDRQMRAVLLDGRQRKHRDTDCPTRP